MADKKDEGTGSKSSFLDKFFGQAALPLMLYAGVRAGLHESAGEALEWAVQLGRDGYERMRRLYMDAAPEPVAKLEFGLAAFYGLILAVAWQALANEGGLCGLFLYGMAVLVAALACHALYLMVRAVPRFLRNDEGMLIRDEHGNRVRDPNSLYSPRAFSLRFSAALIAVTGGILTLGLFLAGAAYESRLLLFLSLLTGAVTLAVLYLLIYIVLWAVNKSVGAGQSLAGLTREQLQVLAAGYTFDNVPRGPARIVDPDVLNRGANFAFKLIAGFFLTQLILLFLRPGWSTLLVVTCTLIVALAAAVLHMTNGGGLTVTDAAYRSTERLFKWAPITAFALSVCYVVLPEKAKAAVSALGTAAVSLAVAFVQFFIRAIGVVTVPLSDKGKCIPLDGDWKQTLLFIGVLAAALLFAALLLRLAFNTLLNNAPAVVKGAVYYPCFVVGTIIALFAIFGGLFQLGYAACGKSEICPWFAPEDHPASASKNGKPIKEVKPVVPDGVTPDENGDVWLPLPAAKPKEEPQQPPPSEPAVRPATQTTPSFANGGAQAPPAPPKKLASKEEWRCSDALIAAIKRRGLGCAPPCVPCD
jgi:hypothetical protein